MTRVNNEKKFIRLLLVLTKNTTNKIAAKVLQIEREASKGYKDFRSITQLRLTLIIDHPSDTTLIPGILSIIVFPWRQ